MEAAAAIAAKSRPPGINELASLLARDEAEDEDAAPLLPGEAEELDVLVLFESVEDWLVFMSCWPLLDICLLIDNVPLLDIVDSICSCSCYIV